MIDAHGTVTTGRLIRALVAPAAFTLQPDERQTIRIRLKEPVTAGTVLALCTLVAAAQRYSQLETPTPLPSGSTLVVGFLGGYDRWNDEHRSIRQLVLRLRERPGCDRP